MSVYFSIFLQPASALKMSSFICAEQLFCTHLLLAPVEYIYTILFTFYENLVK